MKQQDREESEISKRKSNPLDAYITPGGPNSNDEDDDDNYVTLVMKQDIEKFVDDLSELQGFLFANREKY